ncbi:hypothetical protein BLD48_06205 [Exiguobacterium sp. KRL4]|uniref:methyl-accepting chemotaxis protein n=1 Tax=Exiguobacterium sp. KRL4 TaxID=1914536 RepID=UPI0008F80F70|nr:methyl-accepting chemotaxis protein [Exiguobacterium sp. KRL4]OIN67216.1 hypothetical protein BLD48_06205 [Exiguobacterium sp. KRL4]
MKQPTEKKRLLAQQLNNWLIPIVAAGLLVISALSVEELYRTSTKSVSERLEREMTMLDANIRSIYLAYPEDEQERTRAIKRLKNQQLADMARDDYDAAIQSLATKNVAIQPLALTTKQKKDVTQQLKKTRVMTFTSNDRFVLAMSIPEVNDVLFLSVDQARLVAPAKALALKLGVLGIIVLCFVSLLIRARIKKQLAPLSVLSLKIEEAYARRTYQPIQIHSTTFELQQLTHQYNQLMQQVGTLTQEIAIASERLEATQPGFSAQLDSIDASVLAVHQVATSLTDQSTQMEQIVEESSRSLTTSIDALATMDQSIQTSHQRVITFNDAATSSHQILESLQQDTTLLQTLSSKTSHSLEDATVRNQQMNASIRYIQQVAEATRRLSLNALIEATRAGEEGRGFVIVAKEVESLALDIKRSIDQINQANRDLTASIGQIEQDVLQMTTQIETTHKQLEQSTRQMVSVLHNAQLIEASLVQVETDRTLVHSLQPRIREHFQLIQTILLELTTYSQALETNIQANSERQRELKSHGHIIGEQIESLNRTIVGHND